MISLDFYTNVQRFGNSILIRGIREGKEMRTRVKYEPTLYLENEKDFGYKNIYFRVCNLIYLHKTFIEMFYY